MLDEATGSPSTSVSRLHSAQPAIIIPYYNGPNPRADFSTVRMADIFVSYTSSDRDWAFWIAKELKALGHKPHIHEWEIKSGDDIYAWMEKHHDAADHVLCVISDDYLKAPYSTLERNAALWQAAAKRPGFVLLVAVRRCRMPTLSDHIRRCELFDMPENAARTRFRDYISKPGAPTLCPERATVFCMRHSAGAAATIVNFIPPGNPVFPSS